MFNAVMPELVRVLTVWTCTQNGHRVCDGLHQHSLEQCCSNSGGRDPSMVRHCRSFSSFHQFRLLEKSPGFSTVKLYLLGSPSGFPHFEVDDRTLIRTSLGREGNRPDWLKSPSFCLLTLAAFCMYRRPIPDQFTHVRTWIFDAGIWNTLGGAAGTRVAPSRYTANWDGIMQHRQTPVTLRNL